VRKGRGTLAEVLKCSRIHIIQWQRWWLHFTSYISATTEFATLVQGGSDLLS